MKHDMTDGVADVVRLDDDELNRLGRRYVECCIGQILHITFDQYCRDPGRYDELVDLFYGADFGICLHEGIPRAVELTAHQTNH